MAANTIFWWSCGTAVCCLVLLVILCNGKFNRCFCAAQSERETNKMQVFRHLATLVISLFLVSGFQLQSTQLTEKPKWTSIGIFCFEYLFSVDLAIYLRIVCLFIQHTAERINSLPEFIQPPYQSHKLIQLLCKNVVAIQLVSSHLTLLLCATTEETYWQSFNFLFFTLLLVGFCCKYLKASLSLYQTVRKEVATATPLLKSLKLNIIRTTCAVVFVLGCCVLTTYGNFQRPAKCFFCMDKSQWIAENGVVMLGKLLVVCCVLNLNSPPGICCRSFADAHPSSVHNTNDNENNQKTAVMNNTIQVAVLQQIDHHNLDKANNSGRHHSTNGSHTTNSRSPVPLADPSNTERDVALQQLRQTLAQELAPEVPPGYQVKSKADPNNCCVDDVELEELLSVERSNSTCASGAGSYAALSWEPSQPSLILE
mmetsp:Transcript_27536/g.54129  ORF Transcript_27536/g.54129 Transcript_27536/m.54129 type:complete len:426 (+) Transcript_27536:65-1342(+)